MERASKVEVAVVLVFKVTGKADVELVAFPAVVEEISTQVQFLQIPPRQLAPSASLIPETQILSMQILGPKQDTVLQVEY